MLVLAGWLLPLTALCLLLFSSQPRHSEDYGWGVLAMVTVLVSCVGAGGLMGLGVFSLPTKSTWGFLMMGVLGLCALLLLLFQMVVA